MNRPISPSPTSFYNGYSGSKLGRLTSGCFPVSHVWLCDPGPVTSPSEMRLPSRKVGPCWGECRLSCVTPETFGRRGSSHQCCLLPTGFEGGTPVGRPRPGRRAGVGGGGGSLGCLTPGQHPASCGPRGEARRPGGTQRGICSQWAASEEMLITADRWAPAGGQEVTRPAVVIYNLTGGHGGGQRWIPAPPRTAARLGLITALPRPDCGDLRP